jgi:ribosomal protein L11 methyltransferase
VARYPAIEVDGVDPDYLLATVDDFSPTAVQDNQPTTTVFFSTPAARDKARDAIQQAYPSAQITSREVDDEDWARRSQENLSPVAVGRITIHPSRTTWPGDPDSGLHLLIPPSTGFGTGHHATTRLCLQALQEHDLTGASVLDVGTGSGILALAARMLGASDVTGIDFDADALRAARENLTLNPQVGSVRFEHADLRERQREDTLADVLVANLTGALLVATADLLIGAVKRDGLMIVSGLLVSEEKEVESAFAARTRAISRSSDGEWVGLVFQPR